LVALLLFGLMAMAALVIDMGFARLAQRQMQTAADAAALEGLRGEGNAMLRFEMRQEAAAELIAWTFDEDLDASNGDIGARGDGGAFGAGPVIEFFGGAGDPSLFAGQLITVDPNNSAYKPVVQRGLETPGRHRVSLQRGGVLDNAAGLYSQGPSVPFLFARGSLLNRELIGNGIVVRSVATAEAKNAVKVWRSATSILRIEPIAYEIANWDASPTNAVAITSSVSGGLAIGELITTGATTTPTATGYCAIFDSSNNRVVGFGLLGQPSPPTGVVASGNASSRLSDAWDVLGTLSESDRGAVVTANQSLAHALMAPVLVRN
jgi:hypothetical protein